MTSVAVYNAKGATRANFTDMREAAPSFDVQLTYTYPSI